MVPHSTFVRARYSETDKMGLVHHTHHISWFEVGRTELLRERGSAYRDLEEEGVFMPVVDLGCRYHSPARYDDLIEIETELKEVTYVRVRFEYKLKRAEDGKLLATGFTTHVCTDAMGTPQKLSDTLREKLQGSAVEKR